jgi:hypothetical protein
LRAGSIASFAAAILAAALFSSTAGAAGGVHVRLLTAPPRTLRAGATLALKMELWRPAQRRPHVCYRPDPVHHPHVCVHAVKGRLRLCCLHPLVIARSQSGRVERVVARPIEPYALDGRYRAELRLVAAGRWTIGVDDRHGGRHRVAIVSIRP